jgi:RNA polymerase sigma factor (sigma-70 family)
MRLNQHLAEASGDSVSDWLVQLKAGDGEAAQRLWTRYLQRLIRVASRRLGAAPKRVADEEDAVLSAFHAFLEGARDGRFSRLDDRDDLWQVLVLLTERKAINMLRHARAAKRGGLRVRGESALGSRTGRHSHAQGLSRIADLEPTPALAALLREELRQRLARFPDQDLQRLVVGKLEGRTNVELAAELGISQRAVERKLRLVRHQWERDALP